MKKMGLFGIFVIAVLIWLGLSALTGKGFAFNLPFFGTKEVKLEQSFDAGAIQNVLVEVSSTDVRFVRGGSDRIEVRVEGKATPKIADKLSLKADAKGDTLRLGIDKADEFQIGFHIMSVNMTVELPEKQWNQVKAKLSSGDVSVADVKGATLEAQTSSGNVSMEGVQGTSIEAKSGSGNVALKNGEASAIVLDTSSGNVEASEFKADSFKFHSGSGNARLRDGEAKLSGDVGSGNIRIEVDELLHDADLSSGSGNVTVTLKNEPKSLAVDYRGGSGDGKIRWDGFRYENQSRDGKTIKGAFGSGETKLKVYTGSGNFTLN